MCDYCQVSEENGDVFVTGSTKGDFAAASAGRDDVFVLRLCDDQMVTSLTLGERAKYDNSSCCFCFTACPV